MNRYWLRIALGALGIFALGMVAIGFTRRGVEKVKELAAQDHFSIPMAFLPFQLDGQRLGSLERVGVTRSAEGQLEGLQFVARLDSSQAAPAMASCLIALPDAGDLGGGAKFVCLAAADSASGSYIPFGNVRFEPGGLERVLYVPAEMTHGIQASVVPPVAPAPPVPSTASTVNINVPDPSVHIRADERGAHMDIQGKGAGLFHLRADSAGARLVIRDSAGRIIMNLKADSTGAAFDVNGTDSE
jgi:hypothetical protein